MNKKILTLLFFVLVLMSVSAVSAADADGNNDTIVSSADAGTLSLANDVDAIDIWDGNYSDGDGKAVENDAKSVAVGKNNEIYGATYEEAEGDSMSQVLGEPGMDIGSVTIGGIYYVNASANQGGDGSESAPFKTLKDALDRAGDGDTIIFAAGEYKGTDNTGFYIYQNNLNFIKYGEGEAIFDAEGQRRIWTVMKMSVNITGLTFKNGMSTSSDGGGAINMMGGNVINCTFIGNNATASSTTNGGAICCFYYTNVTNCNFTGNYARYMGGAIYFMRGGNVSDCTFTGNTANWWGGAIRLETADNTKGTVTNCAFVNNSAENGKVISSSGVLESVDNNWWGSNDPDWNELINKGGIPSTYAVLNGSADSETIKPGYNAKLNYTFYMNGTANVLSIPSRPIELSATGGHLDDDTGYLVNGEFSTEFSSDALGEFEITATVDNQEVKLTETVAATVWYVNATAAPGGDGKSQATPFQTLKEALDVAEDYDTIMIAAGTYTGENNTLLMINQNNLNLIKYGDGEAIFDAESVNKDTIFMFNTRSESKSVNIKGLTFKNTDFYAICFNGQNAMSDSSINATFINIGNGKWGSAIFARYADNVDITGTFINNTAGEGLIQVLNDANNIEIHDSIFINNGELPIFDIYGSSFIYNNWFGNTADNYNITPVGVNKTQVINWLFLNATADPSELEIGNSSTITFDMYFVNFGSINKYDGPMNIQLDLTKTLGELDKTAASLGEEITYAAKNEGDASVTAAFETASYTVRLKNIDPKTPTYIILENETMDLKVGDEAPAGATLDPAVGNLNYTSSDESVVIVENGIIKAVGDGTANVTVSFNGTDEYAPAERNISVSVSLNEAVWYYILEDVRRELDGASLLLPFGVYNCLVVNSTGQPLPKGLNVTIKLDDDYTINSTVGDDGIFEVDVNGITPKFYTVTFSSYGYTSAVATVLIVKKPTSITLENETMALKVNDNVSSGATLTPADAGNLTYTSSNSTVAIVENGKIKALAKGTATITVSFAGDDEYAAAQYKIIEVTVALNDASVTVNNDTLDLVIGDEFTLVAEPVPAGLDVNFTSTDSSVVTVDADGKVTAVGNGTATIVVSVGDDKVYAINTTSVAVTVKIPTEINITNSSVELYVGGTGEITWAKLIPSEAGNLTYSSNDTSVVWISSGEFTADSAGTALITVSFAGDDNYAAAESKTITVTVSKIPTKIELSSTTGELPAGAMVHISAELSPSEAGNLTYTSNDTNVVNVSSTGVIKANKAGTALITVSFEGDDKYAAAENKTITITVNLNPAIVSVNNSTLDLTVDENATIVAVTDPAGLNVTYLPDNSGVVSVDDNGVVTALKGGTAVIIVKVGGDGVYAENSTEVFVNVTKLDISDKIEIYGSTVTYGKNATVSVILPDDARGNVTVTINDKIFTAEVEGTTEVDIPGLAAGLYELFDVTYSGDERYLPTSGMATIEVNRASSDVLILPISVATYPDNVTIQYFVINAATVRITVLDEEYATVVNETIPVYDSAYFGSFTVVLDAGYYLGVIQNLEDDNCTGSFDLLNFIVYKASPVMETSITEDIKVYTENVTIEVVLPKNATGKVLLLIDSEIVSQEGYDLVNGSVNITVPSDMLTPGMHSYSVFYEGDENYGDVADYATFEVADKNPSQCIIRTIDDTIYPGNVTIEYTVYNPVTVRALVIKDDLTEIVNKTVVPGGIVFNDTIVLDGLAAGQYFVVVMNEGNDSVESSRENYVFTVYKDAPVMLCSIDENITAGEEGVAIHVVLPKDATGRLMVEIDDESINPMGFILINGTADINIPYDFLTLGRHSYLVSYAGDDNYTKTFSYDSFMAKGLDAEIFIDCPAGASVGEDVNVTVTVVNATGFVELYFDDSLIDRADLDENGTATFTVEDIIAGGHYFTVIYGGNDIFYRGFRNEEIYVFKDYPLISVNCPASANVGDDVNVTVRVDNATGFVRLYLDDDYIDMGILDENGTTTILVEDLPAGYHYFTVVYGGNDKYGTSNMNFAIDVIVSQSRFDNITVSGEAVVTAKLLDENGNPIANANVSYTLNGVSFNALSGADGVVSINASSNSVVSLIYAGNDTVLPCNVTIALKDLAPARAASVIRASDYTTYAIDYYAGERGGYFNIQLVDIDGNPLANKPVKIGFNGVVYDRTTNETGWARLQINLMNEGEVTFAVAFLGDDDYNGSFVVQKIIVNKKKTSISASAKSYKASAKTKSYTVTLKTDKGSSIDGQTYLSAGKKLTLKINGKTYTAKTNSKGQATFKLSITKKGKFATSISFEGDKTYSASSKSVKITIK